MDIPYFFVTLGNITSNNTLNYSMKSSAMEIFYPAVI